MFLHNSTNCSENVTNCSDITSWGESALWQEVDSVSVWICRWRSKVLLTESLGSGLACVRPPWVEVSATIIKGGGDERTSQSEGTIFVCPVFAVLFWSLSVETCHLHPYGDASLSASPCLSVCDAPPAPPPVWASRRVSSSAPLSFR